MRQEENSLRIETEEMNGMSVNSVLTLENYVVKNMAFKLNASFQSQGDEIELHPEFKRIIHKIDADTAAIDLIFRITEASDAPFMMDICIEGVFSLPDWDKEESRDLMISNTTAILFPYLRSLITMITTNANIPPYTLPVMNINELFAKAETKNI